MFPCSGCGLCCQNISEVKELKEYDLGNGICKYFDTISNKCEIYDNRPDICNIEKMYEVEYFKYFTKLDFYKENAKVCNLLQDNNKLNKSYRIKIGD